jgi:dolichol-phosphate mannosyltransferase
MTEPTTNEGVCPHLPVTVVVPTRNERDNIAPLLDRLPAVESVTIVDDSTDDTAEVAAAEAAPRPQPVDVIHRNNEQRAGGLSTAVIRGLTTSTSTYVCVMDGDLQHPPEKVADLSTKIVDGDLDIVIASRNNLESITEGLGPVRRVVSVVLGRLATQAFGPQLAGVTDPLSGFFIVRREALHLDRLDPTGFKILLEILVTHPEMKRGEIGFSFDRRAAGASNASAMEALRYLRHLARLRRTMSKRAAPISADG